MEKIDVKGFQELENEELNVVQGGEDVGLGDWVTHYFNTMGKALHDAFGCWKCGLHFF